MERPVHIDVSALETIRVALAGAVILVRHDDVLSQLDQALKLESSVRVSVDLTEVTALDSSGVALLLLIRRRALRAGKTFQLYGAAPAVAGHLHLAGVTSLLGLEPPGDAARLTTGEHPPGGAGIPDHHDAALVEILDEPFDRHTIATVRQQLAQYAAGVGLSDEERYKLLLAASEIMSNAVRHGGGHGRIRVTGRGDRLFLEIRDTGRGMARRHLGEQPRPRPGRIGAAGLWVTRRICERVDIDTGPGGTTVRLVFAVTDGRTDLSS
ncbi:ATP-binding protein [Actinoplanes oblitus]|uniref:ATP-binding protein n=1 Tax=Actinoplanes oblitus TaxID=3040509 RepID=A0ABY8WT65_9ACTN|nr:ATP-binding protein [Actinoplanes oblitus]WIM99793.1 ATP-binding protein [Actinoplanes oblitus]